jgi:hypothetical protein
VNIGGNVTQLSEGMVHTCAVLASRTVRCWGIGEHGRLGYGSARSIGVPASAGDVDVGGPVIQVAAGGFHTCALLADGNVRCWGRGKEGQLGYGNADNIGEDETPAHAGNVPVLTGAAAPPKAIPVPHKPPDEHTEVEHLPTASCSRACANCSTLYDSRSFTPSKPRELTEREHRAVMDAYRAHILGPTCAAKHLHPSLVDTPDDPGQVLSVIDGSFTAVGTKQTLVLFLAGNCGLRGSHADDWGQRLVVLLDHEERLATFVDDQAPSELYVRDLNRDGSNEVLARGGWAGGGGSTGWIEIRSYANASARTFAHFDVSEDTCAFSRKTRTESVIRFTWPVGGAAPCFQQQSLTLKCPARSR